MKNSAGLSKIFLRVYYSLKYMNTQRTKQRVTFSAEYAKLLLLLASCLSTQKKKKNNLELLQEPVNFTKF